MHRCFIFLAFVLLLAFVAVLGAGAVGQAQPATPQVQGLPVQPPRVVPVVPAAVPLAPPSDRVRQVSGFAKIEDDPEQAKQNAEQNALNKARDSVEHFLQEKFPDLHWISDPDHPERLPEYLKVTYLQEIGVIRVDGPQLGTFLGEKGYEVVAHVDVSDPNLRKMQDKVDEARNKDPELEKTVAQRHWLVYRILASFLAVFLVVFGYIRLEELTRGYYTTLLRLAAGAVVLATVLGLFLAF